MKVDVITVDQATFKRWKWWSNWVDVAVFDYNCAPYLLQMRVSRLNKKDFNAMRITGSFVYRQATCREIGDLVQMRTKHE
jgi:hypothetical protein